MFGPDETLPDGLTTALVASAVFVLIAGVLLGTVVSGASGPTLGGAPDGQSSGDVSQQDPDTFRSPSDLSAFERQLVQKLQSRVQRDSVNLSDRQIEQARDRLDDSGYADLLASYRSIAEKRGDEERARHLATLQTALGNYTDAADRYWQVYDEYRFLSGSAAGPPADPAWTRSKARDLEAIYLRANATSRRVLAAFRALDSGGGGQFAESIAAVRASIDRIATRQAAVRAASFVETYLSLSADSRRISFDDPLVVSGRLRAENGSAMADRVVTFAIGNQTIRTRSNATGYVSFRYRPVAIPTGESSLPIRYVPAPGEPYLGTESTVPVSVTAVEPTVTVRRSPETVRYNETVRLGGTVTVDGIGARSVPVVVSANGTVIARNVTTASGSFSVAESLPATVSPSTDEFRVSIPLADRAITGTTASVPVTVGTRATTVSVSPTVLSGRAVRLTGTLSLSDDGAVPNRTAAVFADGQLVTTVSIDRRGRFNTTVVVPSQAVTDGSTTIRVRFEGTGTNLSPSQSRATVTLTPSTSSLPVVAFGGALFVVVLIGLATVGWRSRLGRDSNVESPPSTPSAADRSNDADRPDAGRFLQIARQRLDAGDHHDAVRAVYAGARQGFSPGEIDRRSTHWEFYRACRESDLDADTLRTLRELTELYERVTYTEATVPAEEVDRLLTAVETSAVADR